MIIKKIRKRLRDACIQVINGNRKLKINDSGTTYIRMNKGSIQGKGVLSLNPNAVNCKKTSKLRIDKGGKLIINGNVSLFTGFNIHVGKNAVLKIDSNTFINENALISIREKYEIGKNCAISNNVTILDSNFHEINGELREKNIKSEDKVLIGANTTILKGVTIGRNSVIGAESLVNKRIELNSIVGGNPLKYIKECKNWE